MRNAQHLLRRIVLVAAVGGLVAVPVALAVSADPFGPIEVADPTWRPRPLFNDDAPVLGVDGAGNALLGDVRPRCAGQRSAGRVRALRERAGDVAAHAARTRGQQLRPGRAEGRAGRDRDGASGVSTVAGRLTHYSSVRPPGGAWGAPQVIVADGRQLVQFALSDTGTRSPRGPTARRPGRGPRSGRRAARGAPRSRSRRRTQPLRSR